MKNKLESIIKPVFTNKYKNEYLKIFRNIYPSQGSTGFQERNLTVNFVQAYKTFYKSNEVVAWYEFQFSKTKHIDCLLVDITEKRLFLVESKRFGNSTSKVKSLIKDMRRMENVLKDIKSDKKKRLNITNYKIYGIALADVWTDCDTKSKLYDAFISNSSDNENVISKMIKKSNVEKEKIYYDAIDFSSDGKKLFRHNEHCIDVEYKLLIFSWEILSLEKSKVLLMV